MKKAGIVATSLISLIVIGAFITIFSLVSFTGKVISEDPSTMGPSSDDINCMMACMNCASPGVGCTGNQTECQVSCNVVKPEQTAEETCVETCTAKGCEEFDFTCQQKNQAVCDKECGMVKEPEAKSEEEECIRDCVNAESPGVICQAAEGGEQGNEVCQKCAKSCEYLYAGPCLDELKLETAKSTCNTCEKCYGKPIMGDSGEGYECIVGIECADASAEFGDNPGIGEGIAKVFSNVGEAIGNTFEAIGDFFSNIFSGENSETTQNIETPITENSAP
ncbi:MAG: hypothetical protein AABX17_00185 [Nanoarchaeota archaeon]